MIEFIGKFNIVPSLPENLEPLREIVYNIYWSWNQDAISLFRRIDRKIWESTHHNPVLLLDSVSNERLKELSVDDGFIAHMNRVYVSLETYLNEVTWYGKKFGSFDKPFIAYFSAEYGLTECLQIYSGGLGVLSGDHLKSASDLGIPLVGIGLCYKEGYFQQYLTSDGWQQEKYDLVDFYNQPMKLVLDENNEPLKVYLDFPGRTVAVQAWKVDVGRVPLYLLDTNLDENSEEDRLITRALYGGNNETRIQQEIVLGIAGIRMLHALDIKPYVCHMNEGHSAFLAFERIRYLIENYNLSFKQASDMGFYSNVFTTHTPVPAGIDVFPNELMEKYFAKYYREYLHISDKEFYRLGTILSHKEPSNFNMAHLAMNMAGYVNGVSKLHGEVSKKMWVAGFKDVPFDEIPIDYVTNGIHVRTHISGDMNELLFRYLGENFIYAPEETETWNRVDEIPDEELWRTHERRRERLVAFARKRLRQQIIQRGGSASEIAAAKEALDPSVLTIGFARRFATYKRATLILQDLERLVSILCDSRTPVQFIIAGKAHPRDEEGKKLIQELIAVAKEDHLRKKIVFIENYDMNVARYMVEGCDVWLNNPRRPLEASGTSGMKIIANGGLNFSVLDGWWDEGYDPEVGWKIGSGEEYNDLDYQDEVESRLIYETLEKEIIPLFYQRGEDKLPRGWLQMMKNSMKRLAPLYNTNRMVQQYTDKFYLKAYDNRTLLMNNEWKKGKEFSDWKQRVISNWNTIKFINVSQEHSNGDLKIGDEFIVNAEVNLGGLKPSDVMVQIYYGKIDDKDLAHVNKFTEMDTSGKLNKNGNYIYRGKIVCENSGQFGYTLRMMPKHEVQINQFDLGLIKWVDNKIS